MKYINPITGPGRAPRSEARPFVRVVNNIGASGDQPNVELHYFPPVAARLLNRFKIRIGLRYSGGDYGRLPYYFEVGSHIGRAANFISTSLTLHLDRDVSVVWIDPATRTTNAFTSVTSGYVIDKGASGGGLQARLHVFIRRYQLMGGVPQSVLDPTDSPGESRRWEAVAGGRRLRISQEVTEGGGLILRGSKQVTGQVPASMREVEGLPVGPTETYRYFAQKFELRLEIYNPQHRAPWFVRQRVVGSQYQVTVVFTANFRASIRVEALGVDFTRVLSQLLGDDTDANDGGPDPQAAFLAWIASDWSIDLRLARESQGNVPRPGARSDIVGRPWHDRQVLRDILRRRVTTAPNIERETAIDVASAIVGFIPIVGDVYDIGELAHSLGTGRDFQGREVEPWEILLMGIAVLPGLPSGLRHLDGAITTSRAVLRQGGVNLRLVRQRASRQLANWIEVFRRVGLDASADLVFAALRGRLTTQTVVYMNAIRSEQLLEALRSIR